MDKMEGDTKSVELFAEAHFADGKLGGGSSDDFAVVDGVPEEFRCGREIIRLERC